jgi:hypothetical protein
MGGMAGDGARTMGSTFDGEVAGGDGVASASEM